MPPKFGETHSLNFEQQMVYTMMVGSPSILPTMPFNKETQEVGMELKRLFQEGVLSDMYMDVDGVVRVFDSESRRLI